MGGRGGPHTPGRGGPPQDEGWNTVPISKNRPIDTSRLSKITKVRDKGNFSPVSRKHNLYRLHTSLLMSLMLLMLQLLVSLTEFFVSRNDTSFSVCLFGSQCVSSISLFFQTPVLDFNNQLLAPGGKGTWGSWGKGSSGGTSTKPADSGRFPRLTPHQGSVLNCNLTSCIFILRLRCRRSSGHQHSEQVLSLTAAFVLINGLRQTSSSEVRGPTEYSKPAQ